MKKMKMTVSKRTVLMLALIALMIGLVGCSGKVPTDEEYTFENPSIERIQPDEGFKIDGVLDVHHIHIWSMDGQSNYATMHIVTNSDVSQIKDKIRNELKEHGIGHATLELEAGSELCHDKHCHTEIEGRSSAHHHHH